MDTHTNILTSRAAVAANNILELTNLKNEQKCFAGSSTNIETIGLDSLGGVKHETSLGPVRLDDALGSSPAHGLQILE